MPIFPSQILPKLGCLWDLSNLIPDNVPKKAYILKYLQEN